MTDEQKNRIERLRRNGKGFTEIARIVGVNASSVRMHCTRNGIAPRNRDVETICLNCGKQLEHTGRGRNPSFCCDSCRVTYWRKSKEISRDASSGHICVGCGRTFFSVKPKRKYCSHSCYINARFGGAGHDAR